MTETRKLAAILAADVVGYSRLMGEDEAGTARAVRVRIPRQSGRGFRFDVGHRSDLMSATIPK
jgi:class 3 adenylate cyclase